jgi:hypothetical protein
VPPTLSSEDENTSSSFRNVVFFRILAEERVQKLGNSHFLLLLEEEKELANDM